ncbi:Wzz/FepE/Etk N-terminal domain-containing protein [Campylobacter concisus]
MWIYKKTIFLITRIVSLLAVAYVFMAIPWYKATVTIKTGHCINDASEEILVTSSADSIQKLTVKHTRSMS